MTVPAYAFLIAAIFLNVAAIPFLKMAEGFSVLRPTLIALALIGLTQWLFSIAMQGMNVGLATAILLSAVLTGAAVVGAAYGEPLSWTKGFGLLLALAGIVVAA